MSIQQSRTPGSVGGGRKTVYATTLTETSTIDKEGVGTIRQEGAKFYRWCKYDNGTANITALAGHVVAYKAGHANFTNAVVTPDVSDTDGVCAGVLMSAPADAEYCWVQTRGLSGILALDVTAGALGNAMTIIGAGDGRLDVSALVTDYIAGVLVDTTASAQKVVLSCPG